MITVNSFFRYYKGTCLKALKEMFGQVNTQWTGQYANPAAELKVSKF